MAQALDGPIGRGRIRPFTGPAGTSYGLAVKQGASDGVCALPGAAHVACLGIVAETDTLNKGILGVQMDGECLAIIGAAVAAGVFCEANAAGQLIASAATGDQIIARALTSGANAGDEILVEIVKFIK